MICSDGLTSEVSDDHIYTILTSLSRPQDAVDALIQAALRSGGRDNITVVVVDADGLQDDPEARLDRATAGGYDDAAPAGGSRRAGLGGG